MGSLLSIYYIEILQKTEMDTEIRQSIRCLVKMD